MVVQSWGKGWGGGGGVRWGVGRMREAGEGGGGRDVLSNVPAGSPECRL